MTAVASDDTIIYWQCTRCTLDNINTKTSCDACGGLNPEFSYDGASDDGIYEPQTLRTSMSKKDDQRQGTPTLEGYRIQGIYYKKQRAHRLQHNGTDGANALIALCNLLFLQEKMKWTKGSKRVKLEELQEFLTAIIPKLVLNSRLKDKLSSIKEHYELKDKHYELKILGEMIAELENNNSHNIELFSDLGVKLFDCDKVSLCKLYTEMAEDELCILYKKGGFYATIVKHESILYQFVTEEELIDCDPQITWKTMLTPHQCGNEQYTNNKFGQTHVGNNKIHCETDSSVASNCKLPHVANIKRELSAKLLSLGDEDVDELEHCLFNFSYIAGIRYDVNDGNESYLMYLINTYDKILFSGAINRFELKTKLILPADVRNLCLKYFSNNYIINDIILYFSHQHVSVCYPAVLTIHNIIKLDNKKCHATIKNLMMEYDILNKFHNLICIDCGQNIKETVYDTILQMMVDEVTVDHMINDGLIITLIQRLNDTTTYSLEYKQCLKILQRITNMCNGNGSEYIEYLCENGIIDAACNILKSDQEDDVWSTLDILHKIFECVANTKDAENKQQIIKYITACQGLSTLRDLATSDIQHIARKSAQFIEEYCDLDGRDTQSIEIILFKLGLGKYCRGFEDFGVDYSVLHNLEAPIVECIIQNENHQKQFMFWLNKHQNKSN